jgi:hypothetical protein
VAKVQLLHTLLPCVFLRVRIRGGLHLFGCITAHCQMCLDGRLHLSTAVWLVGGVLGGWVSRRCCLVTLSWDSDVTVQHGTPLGGAGRRDCTTVWGILVDCRQLGRLAVAWLTTECRAGVGPDG